jgi:hypothetical protein
LIGDPKNRDWPKGAKSGKGAAVAAAAPFHLRVAVLE